MNNEHVGNFTENNNLQKLHFLKGCTGSEFDFCFTMVTNWLIKACVLIEHAWQRGDEV